MGVDSRFVYIVFDGDIFVAALGGKSAYAFMGAAERHWIFGVPHKIYVWYGTGEFYSAFFPAFGNQFDACATSASSSITDNILTF